MVEVLLVNPPYERRIAGSAVEPMGLAYLAGALEVHDVSVEVLDIANSLESFDLSHLAPSLTMLVDYLEEHGPPRLLGIGPLVTANLVSTASLIRIARLAGIERIVVGGPLCAVP